MPIPEALEKFLIQLKADGRSPHTVGQYRRHVRTLGRWSRDVRHSGQVSEMSHEDLARFLTSAEARTSARGGQKKATSVNCLRASLRGFFQYCHRAGYIPKDPSVVCRRARCGQAPPRALSDDDARRLLDVLAKADDDAGRRDHALFHLLLRSGIRLTSALELQVGDVDLDGGEVELKSAKGDRPERVFLGNDIGDHLRRYLTGKTGLLFTARGVKPLNRRHVQRRLSEWLKKAGITKTYSPHSLRHSFAMSVYRKTGDILLVQAALHHRSLASTLVYARADEERLRRAIG